MSAPDQASRTPPKRSRSSPSSSRPRSPPTSLFSPRPHTHRALTPSAQEHVLFLNGERTPYRNDTDRELPFRQESNFFYLTGCAVPGASALVRGAGAVQLFLPEIVDADLMWSIVRAPPSPRHCAR
jgi:hypothetical protein